MLKRRLGSDSYKHIGGRDRSGRHFRSCLERCPVLLGDFSFVPVCFGRTRVGRVRIHFNHRWSTPFQSHPGQRSDQRPTHTARQRSVETVAPRSIYYFKYGDNSLSLGLFTGQLALCFPGQRAAKPASGAVTPPAPKTRSVVRSSRT
jgi:hypothetical protein